jgi:hypothetical protein
LRRTRSHNNKINRRRWLPSTRPEPPTPKTTSSERYTTSDDLTECSAVQIRYVLNVRWEREDPNILEQRRMIREFLGGGASVQSKPPA